MIRRPFFDLFRAWLHHLPRSFYLVVVVASAVHILNKWNLPLELPATALLANVAQIYEPGPPAAVDARRHLAVVEIDDQRFRNEYKGISPLDRCKLRAQIEKLLANPNIRVLAIDLDLSPVDPAGYQQTWADLRAGRDDKVDKLHICQYQLEAFLQKASESVDIIAIAPLQRTEGRQPGRRWEEAPEFAGISFGDSALCTHYGMVHRYEYPPVHYSGPPRRLPFAELLTRELCRVHGASPGKRKGGGPWSMRPNLCENVAAPASLQQPADSAGCTASSGVDLLWPDDKSFHSNPISYFETRHLHERGFALDPDDPCLQKTGNTERGSCDIRIVLLGGSYGVGDQHLTPVGKRSGAQIHAAIAAQIHRHSWHGLGIAADIFIGLFFGFLVHVLWGMYFLRRTATQPPKQWWRHPQMAYGWLVLLAFSFTLGLAIVVYICTGIYARWGIWISPVPMALAMLFESTISGSVHAATHKIQHEAEHARSTISALESKLSELQSTLSGTPAADAAAPAAAAAPAPWPAHFPRGLALLMIAYVSYDLIRTLHWPLL